jgi:protoheme IX farnesyltransferase
MSTASTSPAIHPRTGVPTLLSDYALLTKPRVSLMVILTAGAGFYLGCLRSGISPFSLTMVEALFGIALVTAGSSALNQALERVTDRLMVRTAQRPMAQHRIGLAHGLVLGFFLVCAGSLFLAWTTNPITGTLTLLTAAGYVAIYTPLKRITTLNTFIGAFPGALPPLIGWTAARGLVEWPAVALFAVLFVWQVPHVMAIGWMYRDEYASAGIRVTASQPSASWAAKSCAVQAVFYAVLMIPASLWLFWLGVDGRIYAVAASALGLWYLAASIRFARIARAPADPGNRKLARSLLKVSVIYLPLLLAAMMADAVGRLLF